MNVGLEPDDDGEVVSTINTTPLVDVMLVLLIIFLITVPVVGHNVPLTLPKERNTVSEAKPGNINLSVNREGDVFWDERRMPDMPTLFEKLKIEAVKVPQPAVRLRGDQDARYEQIGPITAHFWTACPSPAWRPSWSCFDRPRDSPTPQA